MKESERISAVCNEITKMPKTEIEFSSRGATILSNFFPVSCISALENANDLILLVNINSTIEYSSRFVFELAGFTSNEIIGRSFYSFFPFQEAVRLHAIFKEILLEKRKFSLLRVTLFSKSGEKIVAEVNGVPIFKDGNDLTGYFCIIRNITEREKAEEQLAELVNELKDSISVKDKFFSIVAHDLKTPFHGLLGLSGILLSEFDSLKPEEIKKYLSHLNTSAKSVYNLVNDLLNWARMQTNRYDFQPEKVSLFTEVFKVEQLLHENTFAKGIKIINNINRNVFLWADMTMLQSILLGLLSNAVKFSYPGNEVIVESNPLDDMELVRVVDNGIGIPQDELSKLFKPDTHYTTPGTQKEIGTGLGLLICKEQVEKNGGRIWVESIENKGSTFFFTLPRINASYIGGID